MAGDPFEVDRLFAVVSDESRAVESLGEVLARLEAVLEAKRRLAELDPPTLRAAIAVRHSRLERS
jgi:broad specificity phosphatase PhoE